MVWNMNLQMKTADALQRIVDEHDSRDEWDFLLFQVAGMEDTERIIEIGQMRHMAVLSARGSGRSAVVVTHMWWAHCVQETASAPRMVLVTLRFSDGDTGLRVQLGSLHLPSAVNASEDDIDLVLRTAESFMRGKRYIKLIGCDAIVTLGARMCDGQRIGPALGDSTCSSAIRLVADSLVNARLEAANTFKTFCDEDRRQMDMPRPVEGLDMDQRAAWRGNLFGQTTQKPLGYIMLDTRSAHRMGRTRVRHRWAFPSDHSALGIELKLTGAETDWEWHERERERERCRIGSGRRRPKDVASTTRTSTRTC